MADTLNRQSPLQGWGRRFGDLPEAARISEEPFVAMVDLWVDPGAAGGAAAAGVLGIGALPTTPSTVTDSPDASVIWFGPQEWLICSTSRAGEELEAALRAAVAESGGAAVDVSAQRTTLRLRGAHARDVLAKGSSLDLHPSVVRHRNSGPDHARTGERRADPVERQRNRLSDPRPVIIRPVPRRMAGRRRRRIRGRAVIGMTLRASSRSTGKEGSTNEFVGHGGQEQKS